MPAPDVLPETLLTPALCLNLPVLEDQSRELAHLCHSHSKRWIADTSWNNLPPLGNVQLQGGADSVACADVATAWKFIQHLSAHERPTIVVSRPPVQKGIGPLLAQLMEVCDLCVTCDHYAQVEELSRQGFATGRPVSVLIELNLGQPRFGVRAGWDALHLAQGIDRLPGCRLQGISATLPMNLADLAGARDQWRSAEDLLSQTRSQLLQAGLNCSTVSVATQENNQPLLDSTLVTELRTGSPATSADPAAQLLTIATSVVSRSKLERAVIDCGMAHVGLDSPEALRIARTIRKRPLPDVSIAQMDWTSCTLELGPDSRDLIIGDVVEAIPARPDLALQLFPAVFVLQGGAVVDCWHKTLTAPGQFPPFR